MAAFMKYAGIDGESKDINHDRWIDVLSLDWGAQAPGGSKTGRSRRRGAATVQDMAITMEYEKAAPKLLEKCLQGEVIPKLEIELTATYGGARATYLHYDFNNVLLTSYQVNASGNDEAGPPTVVVANSFESFKVTYTEYDDAGAIRGNVETTYKIDRAKSARKKDASKKEKRKKK